MLFINLKNAHILCQSKKLKILINIKILSSSRIMFFLFSDFNDEINMKLIIKF